MMRFFWTVKHWDINLICKTDWNINLLKKKKNLNKNKIKLLLENSSEMSVVGN